LKAKKPARQIHQMFDPFLFFGISTGTTSFNQFSKNLMENGLHFGKQHSFKVGDNKAVTQHQISKVISNQHNRLCQSASQQFATAATQWRQKKK
jgi:hypothetical protein